MDLSWVTTLVPLLTFGAGAYFHSYLSRKGENLATHEDIDKLVDQVRAVTIATKEIEAKISDDVWDRQKRWELKREALYDAVNKMSAVDNMLARVHAVYKVGPLDEDPMPMKDFHHAANDLEKASLLIALVCGEQLRTDLHSFSLLARNTALEIHGGKLDEGALTVRRQELNIAFANIMAAMRKEIEART